MLGWTATATAFRLRLPVERYRCASLQARSAIVADGQNIWRKITYSDPAMSIASGSVMTQASAMFNSVTTVNATAPLDVKTPRKLNVPDQITAGVDAMLAEQDDRFAFN
jgi:hypothetical protein